MAPPNICPAGTLSEKDLRILSTATSAARPNYVPTLIAKKELFWRADVAPNTGTTRLQLATQDNKINSKGYLTSTRLVTGPCHVQYFNGSPESMVKFLIDSGPCRPGAIKYGLTLHDSISAAQAGLVNLPFYLADSAVTCSKTNQVLTAKEGGDPEKGKWDQLLNHGRFQAFAETDRPEQIHPDLYADCDGDSKKIALAYTKFGPRTNNTESAMTKSNRLEHPLFDYEFTDAKPPHKPQPQFKEYVAAARQYYDEVQTDSVRATAGHRAIDYIEKIYTASLDETRPLKLNIPIYYDSDGQPMTFLDAFKINWRNSICQFEIQALPLREGQVGSGGTTHWTPKFKIISVQFLQDGPASSYAGSQNQPLSINKLLGASSKPITTKEVETEDDDNDDELMVAAVEQTETTHEASPKRSAEENEPVEKKKKKKRVDKARSKRVKSSEFVDADE